jgi:hypothetical protein
MRRALLLACLSLVLVACDPAPARPPTPVGPPPTPTTIVVVVTVPPPSPTTSPTPLPPPPSPNVGSDRLLTIASDGTSIPPRFTLAGGNYLFAWVVPRPTNPRGCTFDVLVVPEPSVSPSTVQPLGPIMLGPEGGMTGNRNLSRLGPGDYTLKPNGDCPWTITITPLGNR